MISIVCLIFGIIFIIFFVIVSIYALIKTLSDITNYGVVCFNNEWILQLLLIDLFLMIFSFVCFYFA